MKYFIMFALVLFSIQMKAQEVKEEVVPTVQMENMNSESIYNTAGIQVKPEFPGGMMEFYKYIGENYKTPNVKGLKGKVFVTFIIEKDGTLTDINVLRDIGHGTGEEAIRVLKKCPAWKPGEQKGIKVRVQYSLPISIQQKS